MQNAQIEFRQKKMEELRVRFEAAEMKDEEIVIQDKRLSEYEAYASPQGYPTNLAPNRVSIDMEAESILVPIMGALVPFHIRLVKSISRNDDGAFSFLRINFFTPGQGKSAEDFPKVSGRTVYMKEMTFRSTARENFDAIAKGFKELQKYVKDNDKGELTGPERPGQLSFEQPALVRQQQAPCLRDLFMRPTIGSSRKSQGNLEAHSNGFRFSTRTEKIDIMYDNIAAAVYEPCEGNSFTIILHLHCKTPLTLGKKKSRDIQFFTEVQEGVEDLSKQKAGSAYDPDEILEEQRTAELKERLNRIFLEFCKKVQTIPTCTLPGRGFDMPVRGLEFPG